MTLIDNPQTLTLRYKQGIFYTSPLGYALEQYLADSIDDVVGALADVANCVGAEVRFGYQVRYGTRTSHCVTVFSKGHPDWIGAFFGRLAITQRIHSRTVISMLSNFEIREQNYNARDITLSYEENPIIKLGYRIVFHSLQTHGFTHDDGSERIHISDYVGQTEEEHLL
jgi:hypothetical protein